MIKNYTDVIIFSYKQNNKKESSYICIKIQTILQISHDPGKIRQQSCFKCNYERDNHKNVGIQRSPHQSFYAVDRSSGNIHQAHQYDKEEQFDRDLRVKVRMLLTRDLNGAVLKRQCCGKDFAHILFDGKHPVTGLSF